MSSFITVIMAGGSGTRFWPLSKKSLPKQYLNLFTDKSLIQETVHRLEQITSVKDIYIASGKSQAALLHEQLPEISNLILEPEAKNTAPCLMLTVAKLLRKNYPLSTPLLVLPADHHIGNDKAFHTAIKTALDYASKNQALVTLGVVPTSPHTGYGYIEGGEKFSSIDGVYQAKRFIEKPPLEKAKDFITLGNFFWNCGIFVWRLDSIIQAFEEFLADEWKAVKNFTSEEDLVGIFKKLRSQPIDVAILEKAENVFVVPADSMGWSDIGSWNALYELKSTKPKENVFVSGHINEVASSGCLVNVSKNMKVALIGVEDLIVIEKEGVLMILHRSQDQLVRQIAESFDS